MLPWPLEDPGFSFLWLGIHFPRGPGALPSPPFGSLDFLGPGILGTVGHNEDTAAMFHIRSDPQVSLRAGRCPGSLHSSLQVGILFDSKEAEPKATPPSSLRGCECNRLWPTALLPLRPPEQPCKGEGRKPGCKLRRPPPLPTLPYTHCEVCFLTVPDILLFRE